MMIMTYNNEKEFLTFIADFLGKSITEIDEEYTIEELEDIYDGSMADKAYKEWTENGKKVLNLDEVRREVLK